MIQIVSARLLKILTFGGNYNGLSFFVFIIYKDEETAGNPVTINHEKIHFYQQLELGFILHWALYLLHFLLNLYAYKGNKDAAYRNIAFEREAYGHQHDLRYLENRKLWAWRKYIHLSNPRKIK